MPAEFKMTRLVEFSDTDMAGIVHYANFFRYMEAAEHAFYRSLGFSVHGQSAGGVYGVPRVHAECDFLSPVRYEETLNIHLTVTRKGQSSLAYQFVFRRAGRKAEVIATGKLVVVYVTADATTGRMTKAPLPPVLARKIQPAPLHRHYSKDAD